MLEICSSLDLPLNNEDIPSVKASVARALGHLYQPRSEDSGASTGGSSSRVDSSAHYSTDDSDDDLLFKDAPLVALFKAATLMDEKGDSARGSEPWRRASKPKVPQTTSTVFSTLSLSAEDLRSVLETTEKYWKIWPACFYGPQPADCLQSAGARTAPAVLSTMLASDDPCIVAKAALFLALCLQQLPRSWTSSTMPAPPEQVLKAYVHGADDLLHAAAQSQESIDLAEALVLKFKLYINMGKPRNAWLCLRRAANTALLLGHHRLGPEERSEREASMWRQVWHGERLCSLTLGLPSAISNSHPSIATPASSLQGPLDPIQHQLCIVAGEIVDRDQKSQMDYLTTLQIDQELESCKGLVPDSFWNVEPEPDSPFIETYYRQVTKIMFFSSIIALHLPYMLQFSDDRKYEYSCLATRRACRDVISNYLYLRRVVPSAEFIICEVLDFQVFNSGVVLVISLLSCPNRTSCIDGDSGDIELVEALAASLRDTASLMRCDVARQGARVLDLLIQAQRGTYTGPEKFVAVLPYFGRVKINFPRHNDVVLNSSGRFDDGSASIASGMLEFSARPTNYGFPLSVDSDQELASDWSAVLDLDAVYDWNQTFVLEM